MNQIKLSKIILSLLVLLLFGVVIYRQLPVGDYQHHLEWARELADKGYIYLPPNNLFQKLVVIIRILIPFRLFAKTSPYFHQVIDIKSYDIATWLLMMVAMVITAWIVYWRLKAIQNTGQGKFNPWLTTGLTLVVMLVGPLFFFTFPDRMYLGYITGNVYHNPTYILLRPLAIVIFTLSIRQLHGRSTWKMVLLGAGLMALAIQAKPSFTLTFLPAVALYALWRFRELRDLNWNYILGALAIPAVLLMAEQYFMTYRGSGSDSIVFAPFAAILRYVPDIGTVFLFVLLSIIFPLAVTVVHWKKLRAEKTIVLAWLNFGIALIIALLFTEVINKESLNFWWGVMIALFILFVETLGQAVKLGVFEFRDRKRLAVNISLTAILGMHLVCGTIYYLNQILFPAPVI